MPIDPISIAVIIGAITITVAVTLWNAILDTVRNYVAPWLKEHLPFLHDFVMSAFVEIDKVVAAVRRKVIESWKTLRPYIVKMVCSIKQKTSSVWVREVLTYIQTSIGGIEPKIQVHRETEELSWEELPNDVRAEILRTNSGGEVNILQERDRELKAAALQMGMSV